MQPKLFGTFHIIALILSIGVPLPAAYVLRNTKPVFRERVLFTAGTLLVLMECGKQLFYYHVVNQGVYDVWFFPFQLCSVPMYLCLILPFLRGNAKETAMTFLWDYCFFGALLALLYPEGMMRPHPLMTLHGFMWHAILLFIAFLVFFGKDASKDWRTYAHATGVLLFLCVIAVCINVLLEGHGLVTSYPDMFYLTPFHHTMQPVATVVESRFGRLCARLAYVVAMVVLGAADHVLYRQLWFNSARR